MQYGEQIVSVRALMRQNWMETEMRVRINDAKVQQYSEEMHDGTIFPMPVVFVDPKSEMFRVGDGFHRVLACHRLGKRAMNVELRRGGYTEAILWCIEANRKQKGLPLSRGDIKRSIESLLSNDDTSGWSYRKISNLVGCSEGYAAQIGRNIGLDRSLENNRYDDIAEKRRNNVVELVRNGNNAKKISAVLGVQKHTVFKDIRLAVSNGKLEKCPHCEGTGYLRFKEEGA